MFFKGEKKEARSVTCGEGRIKMFDNLIKKGTGTEKNENLWKDEKKMTRLFDEQILDMLNLKMRKMGIICG